MTWLSNGVVVWALAMLAGVGLLGCHAHELDRDDHAALRRMDHYCDLVRDALRQDASDLVSDDAKLATAAADRFLEPVTLHGWDDLALCTPVKPAVDKSACRRADELACLAKEASFAASTIPVEAAAENALPRLRRHCDGVRSEMRVSSRELSHGGDVAESARGRFGLPFPFESRLEIELCAPEPPDLTPLEACRAKRDFDCLVRLAAISERAIYVPGGPR